MNVKTPQRRPIPRRNQQANRTTLIAPRSRAAPTVITTPRILSGARDQNGDLWIQYGTPAQNMWFAVADLISGEAAVRQRLSRVGAIILTRNVSDRFKQCVEQFDNYCDAHVAAMPGWHDRYYAFGDGSVIGPRDTKARLIVAFEPDTKFKLKGTLDAWQQAVGPFVTGQNLLLFTIALSLAPAVLRFVPPGYLNVLVEIVGKGELGKSILGMLGASLWCGNPENACGGGEHWDITLNAFDKVKRGHRDALLFNDEGNLLGACAKDRAELLRQLVFKASGTAPKRRFGDPIKAEHVHFALLSTTNKSLRELCPGSGDDVQALLTRMITIQILPSRTHGVFDQLPQGYASAQEASEALRAVLDEQWGSAARHFVAWLANQASRDEAGLKEKIARWLQTYRVSSSAGKQSARLGKSFALIAVAGELGRLSGVIPLTWGSTRHSVHAVEALAVLPNGAVEPSAVAQLASYVARHRAELIDAVSLAQPLTPDQFDQSFGVLAVQHDRQELLISPISFRRAFPDHHRMLQALKAEGRVRGESGKTPKLVTKPPRHVCARGRAYRLVIQ